MRIFVRALIRPYNGIEMEALPMCVEMGSNWPIWLVDGTYSCIRIFEYVTFATHGISRALAHDRPPPPPLPFAESWATRLHPLPASLPPCHMTNVTWQTSHDKRHVAPSPSTTPPPNPALIPG